MMWSYWISLYIRTYCVARGHGPLTLAAYGTTLCQFREWIRTSRADSPPERITARDVLQYCSTCARHAVTVTRPSTERWLSCAVSIARW